MEVLPLQLPACPGRAIPGTDWAGAQAAPSMRGEEERRWAERPQMLILQWPRRLRKAWLTCGAVIGARQRDGVNVRPSQHGCRGGIRALQPAANKLGLALLLHSPSRAGRGSRASSRSANDCQASGCWPSTSGGQQQWSKRGCR
jgi:hypothetical protein